MAFAIFLDGSMKVQICTFCDTGHIFAQFGLTCFEIGLTHSQFEMILSKTRLTFLEIIIFLRSNQGDQQFDLHNRLVHLEKHSQ